MGIPVGTFIAPTVQPQQAPVESLDAVINAMGKGAAYGQATPSIGTAIAQGAQQAVSTYQNVTQNDQIIAQNDLKLKQAQRQDDIAGAATDEATAATARAKAVEANQQIDIANKQNTIQQVLGTGNPEAINAAFTNGEYTLAFSDPKFATSAFRTAAKYLTPDVKQAWLDTERGTQRASYLEQLQQKQAEAYAKSSSELQSNSEWKSLLRNNSSLDEHTAMKRLEFRPADEFQYETNKNGTRSVKYGDDGNPLKTVRDPNNKDQKDSKLYSVYDPVTKKIIAENVSPEFKKTFESAAADAVRVDTNLNDGPVARGLKQANGQTPGVKDESNPAEGKSSVLGQDARFQSNNKLERQAAATDLVSKVYNKDKPITKPDPVTAHAILEKTNFISPDGKVNFDQPVLLQNFGIATGLPNPQDHEVELSKLLYSLRDRTSYPTKESQDLALDDYRNAKDSVVNASLENSYQARKTEVDAKYTPEAIKAHNDNVDLEIAKLSSIDDNAITSMDAGASSLRALGERLGLVQPLTDITQMQKVSTPQELYNLKSRQGVETNLNSFLLAVNRQATAQNVAEINRGKVAKNVGDILVNNFK